MDVRTISGEQIVQMRLERQISQGILGELIGCSATTISYLERDMHNDPALLEKAHETLSQIPLPHEDDGTLARIHGSMSKLSLGRLKKQLQRNSRCDHGLCQLCEHDLPATRLVRVGGDLYALCAQHTVKDVEVWLRK